MYKYAYMLQEHQQRTVNKLQNTDALLVYHGLGSGKTLTGLAAADQLHMPLTVVGPASLKTNFEREKKKHHVNADVKTFTYNKPPVNPNGIVAFDEAHRMGRQGTQRSQYPDYIKGKKTMFLTGTPIRNDPSELIPLLRGLGVKVNKDPNQFNEQFIKQTRQSPGFFARVFRGVEPGIEYHAKNLDKLKKMVKGKVDYHKSSTEGYPKTEEHDIKVEMSPEQESAYLMALKQSPTLKYKIQKGIAPSKSESKQMNAFMTATRQISNYPGDYNLSASLKDAPKINRAAKEIEKRYREDKNYKGVTYSSYLGHGIDPLGEALKKRGIPYSRYTGKMSQTEKDESIKSYNAGKVKHLLISGAGGEGLDLKGTKLMQVLEPHWNEPQLEQVKGRAVRYKSHDALPEGERKVEIQNFVAVPREHGFIFKHRNMGTDEYLQMLSSHKQQLNNEFLKALQEVGSE
jgi:SNF2 family DNA or RNA helicase